MSAETPTPDPPEPKPSEAKPRTRRRVARWSSTTPPPIRTNRLAFRLIGLPLLAVAGVLIYRGLQDHFVLPECDSARAKNTLADVLKQLKLEPARYEPLNTISTSKKEVVCNAVLPLADGGTVNVDYRFFWQGNSAEMRYSVSRKPAQNSMIAGPTAATT